MILGEIYLGGTWMIQKLLFAVVLAVLTTGCGATIRSSHGGMFSQTVTVKNSEGKAIAGTEIFVDDNLVGTTNGHGRLKHEVSWPHKKDSFKLKAQIDGYKPIEQKVTPYVDGGIVFGDIAIGVALGVLPIIIAVAVDGASDAWMVYPKKLEIILPRTKESQQTKDTSE